MWSRVVACAAHGHLQWVVADCLATTAKHRYVCSHGLMHARYATWCWHPWCSLAAPFLHGP